MPQFITALGAVAVAVVALAATFVVGWRSKSSLVLGPVIWMSKKAMNPMQMRTAGRPGAYASIIRHRGRVSGSEYETPIGVVPDGEDFLVALPYGTRAQWLRNVLAAGSATLVHEGTTYRVDQPVLIPLATVAGRFSASDQPMFRLLHVDDCLRLRNVGAAGETDRAA
ncbi:MAG TPA: hypothetical protein VIR16_09200 [Candidatus Limnocylindrales bacterium]